MKTFRKKLLALTLVGLCTQSILPAQTTKTDGTTAVPGPTEIPIPPVLKNRVENEMAALKRADAQPFQSGLTYVKGVPVLMLITDAGEAAEKGAQRRQAIMAAFDFLLDDTSFDLARVCVVEVNKKDPSAQKISNYQIQRSQYQEAAKKASKDALAKSASGKVKADRVLVESVAAELGIK